MVLRDLFSGSSGFFWVYHSWGILWYQMLLKFVRLPKVSSTFLWIEILKRNYCFQHGLLFRAVIVFRTLAEFFFFDLIFWLYIVLINNYSFYLQMFQEWSCLFFLSIFFCAFTSFFCAVVIGGFNCLGNRYGNQNWENSFRMRLTSALNWLIKSLTKSIDETIKDSLTSIVINDELTN